MDEWLSVGLTEEDFWRCTPRQYARQIKGKAAELRRSQNDRAWLAWHTAALPRAKKFPPLRKLMIRERNSQSPEQMLAIAKQWTLLLGGEITGKPN